MFDSIGSKIKTLAKTICWIGIITSVVGGFFLMLSDEDTVFAGFLTMVLGSLLSWIGSLAAYGFGQLIENSDIIVSQIRHQQTGRPAFYSNNPSGNDKADKINTLNKWKAEGLITEEEYNQKMETLK